MARKVDAIAPVSVSLAVAATAIGISEEHLRRACRRGEFPHVRIGERYVVRVSAIDEWLAARERGGVA